MWLGFSKHFGNGFRVGIGTKIGSSKKSKAPTQQQIARLEKRAFLEKIADETNSLLYEYLANNNIDFKYIDKHNINLDALFKTTDNFNHFNSFVKTIEEIKELLEKIQFGSNLTAKRKDHLIDLVFQLRKAVSETGPGLNNIANQIAIESKKTAYKIFFSILAFITITSMLSVLLTEEPTSGISFIMSGVSAILASLIIYTPFHLFLKFLAKLKYKKRSEKVMKETYNI